LPYSKFLKKFFPPLHKEFANKSYLEFGWGDESYYPDPDPSIFTGIKALFWPTDSLLHIAGFDTSPEKFFGRKNIFLIKMEEKQYINLISYIKESFMLNKDNQPILYGKGIYSFTSYFYSAKESFHLFSTCNTWTAKAFSQSGCDSQTFFDFAFLNAKDIENRCNEK
jgi:uncharacterized protein (TIGR02117 family)